MPLGSTFSIIKQLPFPFHSLGPQGHDVTRLWRGAKSQGTGKLWMGGDNHTRDLIPETGMKESLHGTSCYCSGVGIKLGPKLCASCCSQQLFQCLHLAKRAVRTREREREKKGCLHKHAHTSCKCGMPPRGCTAGPQQTSGCTVELRAFSLQPLSAL